MQEKTLQIEIPLFNEVMEKLERMEAKLEQISKQSHLNDSMLNSKECAAYLKVTTRTLQSWRNQGLIHYVQFNNEDGSKGKVVFPISSIKAFIGNNTVGSRGRRGEL